MVESDPKEKFYTTLRKEDIHQISGWCDKCHIKSVWNDYFITQQKSKHLKSSIGDRFPVSQIAPLNSVQLIKKLEELEFLGGGSGGIAFLDKKEKKVYKFISLKESFIFKDPYWENDFINEIELAVQSSINNIGPKIYWHSIYLNYYPGKEHINENIDSALGVIVMEHFNGDMVDLLNIIPQTEHKNVLTECFNQLRPLLIKLLTLRAPEQYLCHDIRTANIFYKEITERSAAAAGGGRTRKKTRKRRKRKKTRKQRKRKKTHKRRSRKHNGGGDSKRKRSYDVDSDSASSKKIKTSLPNYRFVLADFDNSHCTSITQEEYKQWGDIIEILSLCRISIHFSAIIADIEERNYNNFIDHFKTDEKNIIGFQEINRRFINNKAKLKDFFNSDTWYRICEDYWYHTPMLGVITRRIDDIYNNWGSNEKDSYTKIPNDLISIYYPEYLSEVMSHDESSLFSD